MSIRRYYKIPACAGMTRAKTLTACAGMTSVKTFEGGPSIKAFEGELQRGTGNESLSSPPSIKAFEGELQRGTRQ
jgi:hypothetical protein